MLLKSVGEKFGRKLGFRNSTRLIDGGRMSNVGEKFVIAQVPVWVFKLRKGGGGLRG